MSGNIGRRRFVVGIVIVLLMILAQQLLWGKLFPYSPVKIGFAKHELSNVVVYLQDGSEYSEYPMIDTLIRAVEKFHGLRFVRKPELLVFHDSDSYFHRSITKARFCAYPNGSLVVSPWAIREARGGEISMAIYLSHELSHTLLYQHMGFVNAYFFFPRWLLEGIAVYSTNQMGTTWYPSKSETYEYIRRGNYVPPGDFGTAREDEAHLHVKYPSTFAYSECACIIDYLVERYGKEKLMGYVSQLLDSYQHDEVFKDVYGIDFETFLREFRQHVNE